MYCQIIKIRNLLEGQIFQLFRFEDVVLFKLSRDEVTISTQLLDEVLVISRIIIKITISSIVIGLKTLLFSTNSLPKLLSDSLLLNTLLLNSLLSDSSIGQSHSKL